MEQQRARRRTTMVVAGLCLLAAGMVAPEAPASAGAGFASLAVSPDGDSFVFGDPVVFSGVVSDASTSCSGFRDCDTPVGNVVIALSGGGGFNLPVSPTEIEPTASFRHDVPGTTTAPPVSGFIIPGSYSFEASFSGNFSSGLPEPGTFTVTPRPCAMTLRQSLRQSAAGAGVVFSADVSTSTAQATGTVTFFQGPVVDDVVIGSQAVPADNIVTLPPFTGLQAGDTTVNAVYTPNNGNHLGCTRSIVHTVVNGDVPPTANPDFASVTANDPSGTNSVTFDPLANDTDPDGPALTDFEFIQVDPGDQNGPEHGTFEPTPDVNDPPGTRIYTPEPGFIGDETFDYFVTSEGVASIPARININVECTPVAADDAFVVAQGGVLAVGDADDVITNDPRRCEEDVQLEDGPDHGSLGATFNGNAGEFTYTPDPAFSGVDTFTYVYTSGLTVDSRAYVAIQVQAPVQATSTTLASTTSSTAGAGPTSTTGGGSGPSTSATVGGNGAGRGGALARTGDGPGGMLMLAGALLFVGGIAYGAPVLRRRPTG